MLLVTADCHRVTGSARQWVTNCLMKVIHEVGHYKMNSVIDEIIQICKESQNSVLSNYV